MAFVPDEHQQRAIDHLAGWCVVDAAAGSGKSACLIERAASLVENHGVRPESILLLAYNTSAGELLRERLVERLGPVTGARVEARTFHAFARGILDKMMEGDPEWRRMRVLDTSSAGSSLRAMAEAMKGVSAKGEAKDWVSISQFIRESGVDLESPDAVKRIKLLKPIKGDEDTAATALRVCRAFQYEKQKTNTWDFCDMLYGLWIALESPVVSAMFAKYQHVMIDEAQDSTPVRWAIIRKLGANAKSLMVCADMRQTIYSHSGVDIGEFLKFRSTEVSAKYALPVNRRSTDAIVEVGNAVCRGYAWHAGDALSLPESGAGADPELWHTKDEHEEADKVAEAITERLSLAVEAESDPIPSIVVLARTNGRLVQVEQSLRDYGLRVQVRGQKGGMWGSVEGRDVLAYLALAAGVLSDDIANVANKPTRYIKRDYILNSLNDAKGRFELFVSSLRRKVSPRTKGIGEFADVAEALHRLDYPKQVEQVRMLLERHVRAEEAKVADSEISLKSNPDEDKFGTYRALCDIAGRFKSRAELVKSIEAAAEEDSEAFDVELSTCHRMKGAEAEVVYLIGAAQGLLPHIKSDDVEEERRIFYVGVTRAKKQLVISTGGPPSPFLHGLRGLVHEVGKPVAAPPSAPQGSRGNMGSGARAPAGAVPVNNYSGLFLKRRRM